MFANFVSSLYISEVSINYLQQGSKGGELHYLFCGELSGRVLDSRPRGREFEPHRRHCVVVLEQDTLILA